MSGLGYPTSNTVEAAGLGADVDLRITTPIPPKMID
jgi:hypothetical protein